MMDITARLQNWGAWLRSRGMGAQTCESLEGNYRRTHRPDETPTGWGDYLTTAPPPPPPLPPDGYDASHVDRVMHLVPKQHRIALRLFYGWQMPIDLVGRRLAIHGAAINRFLADAGLMVKNLLHRHENTGTIPATIRESRETREMLPEGSFVPETEKIM